MGTERTLERKLKEACLALKLYDARGREWILETYMNQVYYGNRAYGVEAAAQTYFSKSASDLTLAEAAMIAGMPQAPSAYDPFRRQEEAFVRRNEVLAAMLDGRRHQHRPVREGGRVADRAAAPGSLYTEVKEPFFFSFVRDQLIRAYGASFVRTGGLRIYTTIDPRFQRLAKEAIRNTLNDLDGPVVRDRLDQPGKRGDPRDGLGVAGQQEVAVQPCGPGTAAGGLGIQDVRAHRGDPPRHQPRHDDLRLGAVPLAARSAERAVGAEDVRQHLLRPSTLTEATLRSDNSVYARLTLDVGPENVAKVAREMGIRSPLKPVASIGLGSNDVTVLDMASAYATLAAGGVYREPFAIRRIELPSGEILTGRSSSVARSRSGSSQEAVAYHVTRILEAECPRPARERGPTSAARRPARPARPTITPTRGSSATRRHCRRPCGSAIRTRRSR